MKITVLLFSTRNNLYSLYVIGHVYVSLPKFVNVNKNNKNDDIMMVVVICNNYKWLYS